MPGLCGSAVSLHLEQALPSAPSPASCPQENFAHVDFALLPRSCRCLEVKGGQELE